MNKRGDTTPDPSLYKILETWYILRCLHIRAKARDIATIAKKLELLLDELKEATFPEGEREGIALRVLIQNYKDRVAQLQTRAAAAIWNDKLFPYPGGQKAAQKRAADYQDQAIPIEARLKKLTELARSRGIAF